MRLLTFVILLFILGCNISTTSQKSEEKLEFENSEFNNRLDSFRLAIAEDSNNGELFFQRAFYYMTNAPSIPFDSIVDKTDEQIRLLKIEKDMPAVNDFLKAISLGTKIKAAYLNLGVIYTFHDDIIALEYFKKSLIEDPSFEKAKKEIESCTRRIKMNQHLY